MFPAPLAINREHALLLLRMYGYTYNYGWLATGRRRPWDDADGRAAGALASFRLWGEVLNPQTSRRHLTTDEIRDIDLPALLPQASITRWQASDEFIDCWELVMAMSWAIAVAARLRLHEADDVAASVILRLHRARGGCRPAPPAICDWVKTAVLNECRDRWRRQARRPETPHEGEALALLGDRQAQANDLRDLRHSIELYDILARVAATDADLLILKAIADGSIPAEIARDLGLSKMAISRKLARIRTRAPWLAAQLGSVRGSVQASAS